MDIFERTDSLIGTENRKKLQSCRVAVFGVGGVGSYTVEALARAGVGTIALIDGDCVCESNINRQIIALHSTLGREKAAVAAERVADINPDIKTEVYSVFYSAENADVIDFSRYDFVVDAIDTVSSKLLIIERAKAAGVPLISSMGTGNKLDATQFKITDIKKTSVCPLARVMRYELKKRGIENVSVLWSPEQPQKNENEPRTPASISFVPSVAGLLIAGEVIKRLIEK